MKKFLSAILTLILILSITGCAKTGDTSSASSQIKEPQKAEATGKSYMTLLYSEADSFNPYTLKTDVNRQLCKLLYEPLIKVNDNFEPVNALAQVVELEGTECKVTLKDVVFSDGSVVTGEDVVYSYNLARASSTLYGQKLYEVSSAKASGKTVTFTLSRIDPYFKNVLDFPILKSGSDNVTNSDSVVLPPIGSGRYKLNEKNNGLVINEKYYGKNGALKEIRLINAPDAESVAHYTEIGAADMYFSEISDGNITRMSGTKKTINLNNLVYIGINQNYAPLNERALRQALASALDRVKLCEEAYYNNALPATGIFHPSWSETKSVQNIQINANNEITVENLKEIGYNKLNNSGIRVNANNIPLKFTLLVNKENRIRVLAANTVASQLKAAGIEITVIEKSYADYLSSISGGNFQLYLGEIKFTDNMDVSPLFLSGGSAAFGLPKEEKQEESSSQATSSDEEEKEPVITSSQKIIEEFYKGSATAKDVAAVLQTEMAVVPICYRTGVLFYNSKIKNVEGSSLSDIYFSVESFIIN